MCNMHYRMDNRQIARTTCVENRDKQQQFPLDLVQCRTPPHVETWSAAGGEMLMHNAANKWDSDSHMFCTPTLLFSIKDAQFIIQPQHWWNKKERGAPKRFCFQPIRHFISHNYTCRHISGREISFCSRTGSIKTDVSRTKITAHRFIITIQSWLIT